MKKILFVINTMGRAGAEQSLLSLIHALDSQPGGEPYELSLLPIIPRGEMFARVPGHVRILAPRVSTRSVMDRRGRAACAWLAAKALLARPGRLRRLSVLARSFAAQRRADHFSPEKVLWHALAEYAPAPEETYDLAIAYLEGAAAYFVAERVRARHKAMFLHIDYGRAGYSAEQDLPYYARLDKVFCVSNAVKESFQAAFPSLAEKAEVFHNLVDTQAIHEKKSQGAGFDDGFSGIRLLTVGRLHYQKGYDVAIEAMALLKRESGLSLRWYVIGTGGEEASLRAAIRREELEDRFILLGEKDNPYPYMDQCDIYVHATRFEGWSIAITEAKTLCKPIIATDIACVCEQLSNDNAVIINLSPREIADAVIRLAQSPETRERLSQALRDNLLIHDDLHKLDAFFEEER